MIRLRPRIGLFRSLSVLVLIGGLVGGLLISDRKTQQRTTVDTLAAHTADAPAANAPVDAGDLKDAQAKADEEATAASKQAKSADDAARNGNQPASRSDTRGPASGGTAPPAPEDCNAYSGNRQIGCTLALEAGFSLQDVGCLVSLWNRESGWNPKAKNPSSGAYGIAQAVPGSKMASFGADWQTNPVTQIKWGLSYIKSRYKTPCGAWAHSQSTGWY